MLRKAEAKSAARVGQPSAPQTQLTHQDAVPRLRGYSTRSDPGEAFQAHSTIDRREAAPVVVDGSIKKYPREAPPVIVDGTIKTSQRVSNQGYNQNTTYSMGNMYDGLTNYTTSMSHGHLMMDDPTILFASPTTKSAVANYGLPAVTGVAAPYGIPVARSEQLNSTASSLSGPSVMANIQTRGAPFTGIQGSSSFLQAGDTIWDTEYIVTDSPDVVPPSRTLPPHPIIEGSHTVTGPDPPSLHGFDGAFRPMEAVTGGISRSQLTMGANQAHGFPGSYQGHITDPRNHGPNIPAQRSTSLMIQNLPPGCTEGKLLQNLCEHGPFGKVYKTHVVPGGPGHSVYYPTSMAKISMWTRVEAESLFQFINSRRLIIDGYTASVRWDMKMLTPEVRGERPHASRVIRIGGPASIVNEDTLSQYLRTKLVYRTQRIETVYTDGKDTQMVWIFASFQAQAKAAMKALKAEWPMLSVGYGVDPMAEGNDNAAILNTGSVLPLR